MKRVLAAAILALASFSGYAQTGNWTLVPVPSETTTAGYIYHVYSRGNVEISASKAVVPAGLRFICSVKGKSDTTPIIAVFWGGTLMSATVQEISISVDDHYRVKEKWNHDGSLIYTELTNESAFLNALKRGRIVTFNWEGIDSTKYAVAFELRNFNLTEFNNSCKSRT